MKVISFLFISVLFLSCSDKPTNKSKSILITNGGWGKYFNLNDLVGTFVLKKLNSDTLKVYNPVRAKQQYLPASTFKILNSLISLEENVIENVDTIFKWDGKKRFYDKWNQDQNMRTAMKYSCVWFYQELARRIGREKMQYYLGTIKYGNSKLGESIDTFWLDGDLRISAIEQIIFLEKLLTKQLPFSNSNIETVKSILLINSSDTYSYYAKTGWAAKIGWYVGFVIKGNESWLFALNIDILKKNDTRFRKSIAENILRNEGLLK
ncbi:MAG: class D beta-lactamase [Melioribacteraceae bacterium]